MFRMAAASILIACASMGLAQVKFNPNAPIPKLSAYDLLLTSKKEVNWRTDTKVPFELKLLPRDGKKTIATVAVWAFGEPKDAPRGPRAAERGGGNTRGIQRKSGRIVFVKSLGEVGEQAIFNLDFADFAPRPTFFVVFSVPPKDLTPAQLVMYNAAKAMEASNKSDAQALIANSGSVEYHVQVTTADGAVSPVASVKYGEPKPGTANSEVEFESVRSTPEFPEAQYSTASTINKDHGPMVFRWRTQAKAKSAIVRLIDGQFTAGWGLWVKEGVELAKSTVSVPPTGWGSFSFDSKTLVEKSKTGVLSIQVTPLKDNGDMAGMPSKPVILTIGKQATPPPSQSPKLSFQVDLVGWRPPYLGAPDDKYRFVIGGAVHPKIQGDVTNILGKAPAKGDKLYLPPKPPKEEDAWYKKVVKFVASVIDFISKTIDLIVANVGWIVDGFLKAGPNYLAKKAGYSEAEIKKAWSAAETPLAVAGDAMSAARAIKEAPDAFTSRMLDDMGVKDTTSRQALRANFAGIIEGWASDNSYLAAKEGPMQGLAPDPDFMIHTAIAFVRVRTNKVAGLPKDYREPGPSVSLKVGAFSWSASNLGLDLPYFELFEKTLKCPSMAPGDEIILALPLNYHWTHDSNYKTWFEGVSQAQMVRYTLNGKAFFGEPLFKTWGKGL